MKHAKTVVCAAMVAAGCGSEWHMPFSNANPTLPSNISIGAPRERQRSERASAESEPKRGVPRNQGTRVWLAPAPAGDMMRLVKEPTLWQKAQERVDVFQLYFLQTYDHEGFECGTPCGPNTYPNLMKAVPGGMYRWLSERYLLAIEAGSVRAHSCTQERVAEGASGLNHAISTLKKGGATVDFISLDEPFMSGLNPVGTPGFGGCGITATEVARLQWLFNDALRAAHPEVRVGLIEPYPHFSADRIMSFVLELEHAGAAPAFLHVDLNLPEAVRDRTDTAGDLRRLRDFCVAKNIPFGVIIMGGDGRSDEQFTADAWGTMRMIASSVGVTSDTMFQSWAESEPGNLRSTKTVPDTVPETSPVSHTGQLLRMLEYMNVQEVK